jgi:hypothetical protein
MLMPARVAATLTDAQTRWVSVKCLGQGLDQSPVTPGDAFFHQGGEPADEIHIGTGGRVVQRGGYCQHLPGIERGAGHGNGAD